jgi:uncharacterized protein DUF2877
MVERWHARRVSTAILGRLREPGSTGRVHSVFAQAINVLLDADELITLSTDGLPNGIELASLPAPDVSPGEPVQCSRGCLRLGDSIVVDVTAAEPWSPELPPRLGPLRPPADLCSALRRTSVDIGFGPLLRGLADLSPMCVAARPAIARLRDGIVVDNLEHALSGARGLVGLGDGLTPSGDDLLVGLSAGLRVQGWPLATDLAWGCAQLARGGATTRIAAMFHQHAAAGAYSDRIHRLIRLLGQPAAAELVVDHALTWGASSGLDMLYGLLLAATPPPAQASSKR